MLRSVLGAWLAVLGLMIGPGFGSVKASENVREEPLSIQSRIKPNLWKRMLEDREVLVYASLDKLEDKLEGKLEGKGGGSEDGATKKYSYYTAMLVRASLRQTHEALTNYRLYSEIVPFVDHTEYSEETGILKISGGIWGFKLRSNIIFSEPSQDLAAPIAKSASSSTQKWIRYEIVRGSFNGLVGNIFFESLGERGTAVYFNGEQMGKRWPPQFVIERGAEIVLGFTATRMRSYIESQKTKGRGYAEKKEQQEKNNQDSEQRNPASYQKETGSQENSQSKSQNQGKSQSKSQSQNKGTADKKDSAQDFPQPRSHL